MSKRLTILKNSLIKKEKELDQRFATHFADVRSANGQPLNDKRNGNSTSNRWERQNNAIRNLKLSIEKTKKAIEKEEDKILNVEVTKNYLPQIILDMVANGELIQWRKHPNRFFVPDVEKTRIVYEPKTRGLHIMYIEHAKKDQKTWSKLAKTYNKLAQELRKL